MRIFDPLFNFLARTANALFVRSKLLPKDPVSELGLKPDIATFYITRLNSRSDRAALAWQCRRLGLPDPREKQALGGKEIPRFVGIENPSPLFGKKRNDSKAIIYGGEILTALAEAPNTQVQVVPVTILWGRNPGKEKPGLGTLLTHSLTPSWLRKLFVVLFSGRDTLIRFSKPLELNTLLEDKAHCGELPHKLIRVARVHFRRQKLAATGPKLPTREQLFNSLLASPTIKKAVQDEAKTKKISLEEARQNALKLLEEIAANYSDAMVRVADRILTWLWTKLYNGIEVKGIDKVHELTNKGHEVIYVPCHRSHMDYLLLTYVIYHQGLVPPHIAAGINLNFFPAGGIFRRSGAFFIRRSFAGNKLYSAVFKEYLSQLFIKGYSVKFYTEGGRSRTGRLLPPKTGMLAMTIQAMLRGIDRPVSIVPVYIGYEHVMEINTYLKELAGDSKKNESVFGILKAIKNLKNYGRGYLNFGEPISINQYLNEHQPDWREAIHPTDVQKPAWLGPQVASLADQIMEHINSAAALNAVNLLATILLVNEQCALSKPKLLAQMDFYLDLQRSAGFSNQVSVPDESAEQLLEHALKLNKFDVLSDPFGEIITVHEKERVLFNYYRNNILHLFAVPSMLAQLLYTRRTLTLDECRQKVAALYPLFAHEWFMPSLPEDYVERVLANFASRGLVELNEKDVRMVKTQASMVQLEMLGKVLSQTLQRYAIVVTQLENLAEISQPELESRSQQVAERLGTLHGIKSPEFFDPKVLSTFIAGLKQQGMVSTNDDNRLTATAELSGVYVLLNELLPADIWQSISDTVSKQKAVF